MSSDVDTVASKCQCIAVYEIAVYEISDNSAKLAFSLVDNSAIN